MLRRFKVVIEEESEGGYSVFVPSLPGCASQGDTIDEALKNIKEAAELYLESLQEDHLSPPSLDVEVVVKDIEVSV